MIRERDKARKILNAIVEYFVIHDFKNISANIKIEDKLTTIKIKGYIDPSFVDINRLREILDHPRVGAYENYYDDLLDSDSEDEINIIGYLIDEAEVNFANDVLSINLIRKHIL